MIILASRSLSPRYPNRIYFFLLVTISVRLPFHYCHPTSLRHYILGVQPWGCRHLMVHGGRNPWHNAEAYFCDCSGFDKIKLCASGILAWSVHSPENVLADWNQRADRSVFFCAGCNLGLSKRTWWNSCLLSRNTFCGPVACIWPTGAKTVCLFYPLTSKSYCLQP